MPPDPPADRRPGPPAGLDLSALRARYDRDRLDEHEVPENWLTQFEAWFAVAAADPGVIEVNAMQLATVSAAGRPAVRTVLAKSVDAAGVTFFTNHDSAKGRDLDATRAAAAVFSWLALERQVRLAGRVERVSRERTEAYFATRPRGSQLGAWASPQSSVVDGRAALDASLADVAARFADGPVPAPPGWGGYLLVPDEVEFWQGRPDRMHDRVRYSQSGGAWSVVRLAP